MTQATTALQTAPEVAGNGVAPVAPPPRATVAVTGADGTIQYLPIPATKADVEAIRSRRSELSDQLTSAAGRRRRLSEELAKQPPGPAREGIEGRLVVLDRRLAQLESDIAATGRQLTAAPEGLVTSEAVPVTMDIPENVMTLGVVATIFVFFPLALALARSIWKRGSRVTVLPAANPESAERLERLEQGVEAIAIEVERISEGQRFVTKLMAENLPAARIAQGERAGKV